MRVAHLITDLDVGGAETMLARLVPELAGDHRQLVLAMTGDAPLAPVVAAGGARVARLGMPRGRPSIAGAWRAVVALRAFRPHILQTWLYHADLLGTVLRPVVGMPALIWNLRCVDMDLTQYGALTRHVRRMLSGLSRVPGAVIANSEAGRRAHEGFGYRPRRWAVIHNGFDVERFRPCAEARGRLREALGVAQDTRIIGMVARRDPAKDHLGLLDAMVEVLRADERTVLYLVGAGTETLHGDVEQRGLGGRVLLAGLRRDVEAVYPGLDVCVLSSAFGEGFPNVIGEAMACGVPCVATDVGDVAALIGGTGLIVPRRDPRALASALTTALRWDDDERSARGRRARQRIEREFTIATIARRYARLYQEVAQAR